MAATLRLEHIYYGACSTGKHFLKIFMKFEASKFSNVYRILVLLIIHEHIIFNIFFKRFVTKRRSSGIITHHTAGYTIMCG